MKKKISIMLLFFLLFVTGCFSKNEQVENNNEDTNINPIIPVVPKLKIVDEDSDERSISVMIDNHPNARPNHVGLSKAYLVYEILVEGGYTRYMAVFKDSDANLIGPVRSSRHYYLDYALENDAIYGHFGWSPKAQSDITTLKINNINGLVSSAFFRDNKLFAPHNAFTSIKNLKEAATKSNYSKMMKTDLLLKYDVEELIFDETVTSASEINLEYSRLVTTNYLYDSENKVYMRSVNGTSHKDKETKEQYSAKNIIAYQVDTITLDSSGRIDLKNIGTGEGYYFTNGKSIPIKWSKSSRGSQTKYYNLDGSELIVNDGNTYIQILPKAGKINIIE